MCPSCKSEMVRPSRSQKLWDRLMKYAGMVPYRCRECNRRFFISIARDSILQRANGRSKKPVSRVAVNS